jgi:hypothetical protein
VRGDPTCWSEELAWAARDLAGAGRELASSGEELAGAGGELASPGEELAGAGRELASPGEELAGAGREIFASGFMIERSPAGLFLQLVGVRSQPWCQEARDLAVLPVMV